MNGCCTPPHSELATTTFTTPPNVIPYPRFATPVSLEYGSPETMPVQNTHSLELLTQTQVNSSAEVKRLQQDLLILTGFNDNSTLHWRPVWFTHRPNSKVLWTLHNPPNVVTERLPNDCKRNQLFTRRMRRTDDPPPQYIKSWSHWKRYCLLYDVPDDFLSEGQVRLLRMGLSRSPDGLLCTPPQYPLYPEPPSQGRYVLKPSMYSTHLPRKFQQVVSSSLHVDRDKGECVVVDSTGELTIKSHDDCLPYRNLSKGHRWSYIPWTMKMEKSCRPLTVKLRLWNEAGRGK